MVLSSLVLVSPTSDSRFVHSYIQVCGLVLDLGQDLSVGVQQVLLLANLHWGASKVWQQNLVTWLHRDRNQLTGRWVGDTWTRSNNGSLIQFLLVLLWDVDTAGGLGGRLNSLHQDSVEQWLQVVNVFQKRLQLVFGEVFISYI